MAAISAIAIIGATGGFGGAVLNEAASRHVTVRALSRRATGRTDQPAIDWIRGDCRDSKALDAALAEADAVIFAVNAAYDQWPSLMPAALDACIQAVQRAPRRPRLVFPGNVYGLGLAPGARMTEDAPNAPLSSKGRLRVSLEERLSRAAVQEGVPVLILRGADFFGPTARNGLVDRIFGNAARGDAVQVIGAATAPHQFTYLPDMARACLDLLCSDLPDRAVVNAPVMDVPSLRDLGRRAAEAAGYPSLAVRSMPWAAVRLFGLFSPVMRELVELRYLFEEGVFLDDALVRRLLPEFRPTPLTEAVAATVASYRAA